ncbi:MAG: MATE family efflux transporter [Chloroflexi bacterium]|nr:MATE family efflux transporter [Chloroflexota bacterium]
MPPRLDARTLLLLEAPIAPTLVKLAAPNILVNIAQSSIGLIETYFVGRLGTDALAGVALVFPVVMLTQMMSAGAVGGGISSAVARALGGQRRRDADDLALHSLAVGLVFGLAFTVLALAAGPWLYGALGGRGASLAAAVTYSNVIFAGAILIWVFNSLASVIRGTGNMHVPALVTCVGVVAVVPLSPCLIFGLGPFPQLGVAGGGTALLAYYAVGCVVLAAYIKSGRIPVRLSFSNLRLRGDLFADILRVGGVSALVTIGTNVTVASVTGLVGTFGPAAIAGYGVGSRLEYVLVPLVFGLGAPLVALVGTNVGAGRHARAVRVAWIGAFVAAAMCAFIGALAAVYPRVWLGMFDSDAAMLAAGSQYLQRVGPFYGFFGLGLGLYFAFQGFGRLRWAVVANFTRLTIAVGGGWLALRLTGDLSFVFVALSIGMAAFGLINAAALATGAVTAEKHPRLEPVGRFEKGVPVTR